MRKILLNKKCSKHGRRLYAIVDDKDYEWLNQFNWCAVKSGHTYYVVSSLGKKARTKARVHRMILDVTSPKRMVDHKNGNGLDNRRANLRVCNRVENTRNQKTFGNKTESKYTGVNRMHGTDRWQARIQVEKGLRISLGGFKTQKEAARARDKAAKLHFGEFARLNFKEK